MEYRLNKSGILSIQELYNISPKHMRKIWGNVQGEKFWYMLRGKEIADIKTERKTIGHSHVLEPKWRLVESAEKVMLRLLLKAASRLRRMEYYCSRLSLSIRTENNLRLEGKSKFYRACDNKKLQEEATKIWKKLIKKRNFKQIKKISITLYNLKKKSDLQPELFQNFNKKIIKVSGDKSLSIRWVLLASLANGVSKAKNLLISDDVHTCFDTLLID